METYEALDGSSKPWYRRRGIIIGVMVAGFVVVLTVVILAIALQKSNKDDSKHSIVGKITIERLMKHLQALEDIAYAHNGSRTAQTGKVFPSSLIRKGYNASVEYVESQLKQHSDLYEIWTQDFSFPFFEELEPPQLTQREPGPRKFIAGLDFRNLRLGGSGNVTQNVGYVGGACNESDFQNFPHGAIALMDRGYLKDCSLPTKLKQAIAANASAIIVIYDPGTVGLFGSGLEELAPFPAFSVTYKMGQYLIEMEADLELEMFSRTHAPITPTKNLFARTKNGDAKNKVVVGSHLDSVPAGPGINDNGSGSSANLELALQWAASGKTPKNQITFAWWGAEEFGLLGSKYFVRNLSDDDRKDIALNLVQTFVSSFVDQKNYDMLGSPNFLRGVYNGSSGKEDIRVGSTKLQKMFESFLNARDLAFDLSDFNGRSDYGPFIEVGIPAGGLDTGAEVIKTAEGRKKYGGMANVPYDPCYHLVCDTVANVHQGVFMELAKAAASVLEKLAEQPQLREFLNKEE